jgi:hypothetical protein
VAHDNTEKSNKKPLPLGFIPVGASTCYGKTQTIDMFGLHEKIFQAEMDENSLKNKISKILSNKNDSR